jgi:hypothetical protein
MRLLLLALPLALLACGGGGEAAAFRIASSTPFEGANLIPIDMVATVRFTQEVAPASVAPATIRVFEADGTEVGGATTTLSGLPDRLRWTPAATLAPATTHRLVVASTLLSTSGEAVGGDLEVSFTTSGPPVPPIPLGTIRPAGGTMVQGRRSHRATLLSDESVLVTGGFRQGSVIADTGERFDPSTERFTLLTPRMEEARAGHVAVLLPNGRVLLAGGWTTAQAAGEYRATDSAEVYDPVANDFLPVGSMTHPRADAAGILLPDGRVLVTGGSELVSGFFLDHDDAEVFDPGTGAFSPLPSLMSHVRATHGMEYLGNGRVLVAGGSFGDLRAEVFDPVAMTFSPLAAAAQDQARFGAAMAPFASGAVSVAGGDTIGTVLYARTSPLLLQNSGSALTRPRAYATSTPIGPTDLLVAGGVDFDAGLVHASIDLVREAGVGGSQTFATALRFGTPLAMHAAARLSDGRILFCGGLAEVAGQPEKDAAFVYQP